MLLPEYAHHKSFADLMQSNKLLTAYSLQTVLSLTSIKLGALTAMVSNAGRENLFSEVRLKTN